MCKPIPWPALAMLLLVLAGGCMSEQPRRKSAPQPGSGGSVQEINLLAVPVALDLDNRRGPDGFVIKIYAGNRKRPKPFPLENGQIEVLMFDGVPEGGDPAAKPRRVWTYTVPELRAYEVQTSIGTGYQLALAWGDAKPLHDKITVVVRYSPQEGRPLISAPSIIAAR